MDEPPSSPRRDATGVDRSPDEDPLPSILVQEDQDAFDDDPTGRLAAYLTRTQTALDILALLTLWIVIVPVADFGDERNLRDFGLSFRLLLSLTYGVDMAIRTRLAQRHWHYLRTHPLGVLAVIFPPVRVLFSLRLIRQLFQRGNLRRFLIAALLLMLNGALIVWLFERDVPDANIVTLGDSIWWSGRRHVHHVHRHRDRRRDHRTGGIELRRPEQQASRGGEARRRRSGGWNSRRRTGRAGPVVGAAGPAGDDRAGRAIGPTGPGRTDARGPRRPAGPHRVAAERPRPAPRRRARWTGSGPDLGLRSRWISSRRRASP